MSRARPSDAIAIGIDIVELRKISRLLMHGPSRLRRVFNPCEIHARNESVPPSVPPDNRGTTRRLACIFAGKEAIFKALGRGWGQGVRWNDISLKQDADGRWSGELEGGTLERLREVGGVRLAISISAGVDHVVAQATIFDK
jgi:holo-[acyl-carrier protein] synthase